MDMQVVETGVLVIGGGAAAVRTALAASAANVDTILISKGPIGKSGATPMAGGAVALPIGDPRDNSEVYYRDHMKAGRGLADPDLARVQTEDAATRVLEMVDYGVNFLRKDGRFVFSREPGHSYRRNLRTLQGGVSMINPLRKFARGISNLRIYEDMMAIHLLVGDNGAQGALALDLHSGDLVAFLAQATVLATGGYQDLYPISDAGSDATGDGYAMAYQAGAALIDMEMLLYYPSVIVYPYSARGVLVSYEYFLHPNGLDGRIVDADGVDLLAGRELPMRDEMARFIFDAVGAGRGTKHGGVYIDLSLSRLSPEEQEQRIKLRPAHVAYLNSLGVPVVNSRLEVAPAAHYVLGGIKINRRCETSVPGLFAVGEVAGNLHGANRLAGTAITETQVFGCRAGHFAALLASDAPRPKLSSDSLEEGTALVRRLSEPRTRPRDPIDIKQSIRVAMLEFAGPNRDGARLATGIRIMQGIVEEEIPRLYAASAPSVYNSALVEALEAQLMAQTAQLVLRSALERQESRGHHYRADFPCEGSGLAFHTVVRNVSGLMDISRELVLRSEADA